MAEQNTQEEEARESELPEEDENQPLLELDTAAGPQRRCIEIDSKRHELRFMNELSLSERLKFVRRSAKLASLANMDQRTYAELSDSKIKDLENALHQAVCSILDAPEKIVKKLTTEQKMSVIRVFTPRTEKPERTEGDQEEETPKRIEAPEKPSSPETTAPYQLSKDTTEGAGKAG